MDQTIPARAEFEDVRPRPSAASKIFSLARRFPVLPGVILAVLAFTAVFAPILAPFDPIKDSLRESLKPPVFLEGGTVKHILGTDDVGRDILSRMIYGARISLMLSAVAVVTGLAGGVTLGVISGYFGGWLEEIILRIVDVWLAMPFILFALVVVSIFGKSLGIMFALLAALAWSAFVRNIRAEVLVLREMDYVQMSRVLGASPLRIMLRHILPGVVNTAVVISTLRVGQLMLAEASLSFLGAGIPDPIPAWGVMVSSGRDFLGNAWWISFFPGFAIFLVVMALNFMGDWLRDFFDPRLRQLAR